MTDVHNHKPIRVLSDEGSKPYITAPVDQLKQLREILDANGVSYWVEHNVISVDGRPAMAVINLRGKDNIYEIQEILDRVA